MREREDKKSNFSLKERGREKDIESERERERERESREKAWLVVNYS